jgi:hypothetical protein
MARLVKQATPQTEQPTFNVGDKVYFYTIYHDGRSYDSIQTFGAVVKINRVTVDIEDKEGNVWRENKDKVIAV